MKIRMTSTGTLLFMFAILLSAAGILGAESTPAATSSTMPTATPSALETTPTGWIDLLKANTLDGWLRVGLPNGGLKPITPWMLDSNHHLMCDGTHCHEMLLFKQPFADGIFHVEWCFRKIEGKKGYNSGVFVRTAADNKIWHQAQVGNARDVGYLFGDSFVDGVIKRIHVDDQAPSRGHGPGEWNTYEITCRGKVMTLWINGGITATWNNCQVPDGLVGLEAEGWIIEFRNVKFMPLK